MKKIFRIDPLYLEILGLFLVAGAFTAAIANIPSENPAKWFIAAFGSISILCLEWAHICEKNRIQQSDDEILYKITALIMDQLTTSNKQK